MNLKLVDAALAYYAKRLEEYEVSRLSFFRKLWQVQSDASARVSEMLEYQAPDADTFKALVSGHEPILRAYPTDVDKKLFEETIRRMRDCIDEDEDMSGSAKRALANANWSLIMTEDMLYLAGSNPAEYIEQALAVFIEDGMNEEQASVCMLITALALRAMLNPTAEQIEKLFDTVDTAVLQTVDCPVCGGQAAAARVGETGVGQGRARELWCAQCGTAWPYQRVRCARCGTQNQSHLHYYNIEGDDSHRLQTCDECGNYMRTVFQEDALVPFSFEVEDAVMAKLDLVAYQMGQNQQ